MELKWNASEESHLRIIPYRLFFNLPLQQDPNHLFTAMHRWILNRESISYTTDYHTHVEMRESGHVLCKPLSHHVTYLYAGSEDALPAVCSGVLHVLLSVLQTSGTVRSRCCMTRGSPSLQAMWKEFQPSLFLSAGSAPWHSSSWITARFLRVQAIIRGVLSRKSKWNLPKLAVTLKATTQWDFLNIVNTWDRHTEKNREFTIKCISSRKKVYN